MEKVDIFICAADEEAAYADIFCNIFNDSYGCNAFFFKHSLVPSEDFFGKISARLKSCEIFVPLLSSHLIQSSFCNQEIGFSVNNCRNGTIFPISLDGTKPQDMIDHIYCLGCDTDDKYGILKAATEFFHIVLCHENFKHLANRATNGLIEALKISKSSVVTSGIVTMLSLTQDEVVLTKEQLADIVHACKNNSNVYAASYFPQLKQFLSTKYNISLD